MACTTPLVEPKPLEAMTFRPTSDAPGAMPSTRMSQLAGNALLALTNFDRS